MVYSPGVGKTPNDWAEEEVRRRESRARTHNPYGRELGSRTRTVLALLIGGLVVLMVVLTFLGLLGITDLFERPPGV